MEQLSEIIKAVVFGIIQGITEWLPISSTGHLLLADEFLKLQFDETFVNTFFVVIQLGSILAVVILYFKKLWPFQFYVQSHQERWKTWKLWFHVLVGCIPAGIVGYFMDDFIDAVFYNRKTIAIALIVYGIGFLIVESIKIKPRVDSVYDISYITAFNVGVFQMLALIPGTSRSGSTILGGRMLGISREAVSEFSFFMALPVMAGASLLKILKAGFAFSAQQWIVLGTGTLVSFLVSVVAIKFMMNYIRKHDFKLFGVYRIILGVIIYFYGKQF
ncbi:MAG: undecaprenyl-diphosphate phosphatase [Erysipelotrichaceae bacterium]|nr:undecaprenyl-diphosphate phosphatase [Erysipelotrichaceae bacterium]